MGARFVSSTAEHFNKYYMPLLGQMGFSLVVITEKYDEQLSVVEICEGNSREE